MIVAGVVILLCALFFIFFGTRTLINEAYLANGDAVQVSDNISDESTADSTDSADKGAVQTNASNTGNTQSSESASRSVQEKQTSHAAQTQQATISVPGIKSLTVTEDSTTASVDLYNPNKNECYFEISILLKDSNRQIYKSDLVRPGQHIYEIQLSTALEAGEYEAILHYDAYTMDGSNTELNGADVAFTLIVE